MLSYSVYNCHRNPFVCQPHIGQQAVQSCANSLPPSYSITGTRPIDNALQLESIEKEHVKSAELPDNSGQEGSSDELSNDEYTDESDATSSHSIHRSALSSDCEADLKK